MKRNRLIRSSDAKSIFSTTATHVNKRRNLLVLSLLTFTGIFLTSMVLATDQSVSQGSQSKIIDLPNLPAEMQTLALAKIKPQTELNINTSSPATESSIVKPVAAAPVIDMDEVHTNELAAMEQQASQQDQSLTSTSLKQDITESVAVKIEPNITWKEISVKSGDNLSLIFSRVGLSASDVYHVAQLGKEIKPLLNLKPGQIIRFGIDNESSDKKILKQLDIQLSAIKKLSITATDNGFVANTTTRDLEKRQSHASGTIESSLFEAGLQSGLSDKLVMELAYIFGWDIDFSLDLRQDDSFSLIFDEDYLDGDKISDGVILAAEFTNQGKTYRAIRYTDTNELSGYYAPNGDSMRKTFSRSPVHFSRISSKFNPNRKHPVLKTSRPHRGVDYAAARGTPITATGDGKVDFVGRKGGYGRTIVLSHGGKYTTLYAHMSSYRKGIKRGKRVKQGDTIGYIGSSGLATGPHLHYEFRVNGVHRNPLTVALPKAEPLPKKYLADFSKKAQPFLASLDALRNTSLALNN
ncbi:MAG: peptidase M23 [Methylophaga sp.]|nr:MAG: peptidase M23 [Methylophaga sp.]